MERLEKKYEHLSRAIASFEQALFQYKKWQTELDQQKIESLGIDYDGVVLNLRDSTIQRFEYSIDLFWKYLKTYLDEKLNIVPDVLSPNSIIRHAGRARIAF